MPLFHLALMRKDIDMKKKILPVIAAIAFIFVVLLFMFLGNVIEKYTPTDETLDLSVHYQVDSQNDVAIIYNHELIDSKAKLLDGVVYLSLDTVKSYINSRFYWDTNENILRYVTAKDLVSVPAESTSYTITKDSHSSDHIIVKLDGETPYLAIDFIKQYSDFTYSVFENPNRLILTTAWGEYTTVTTKKKTQLRVLGGIKSPILAEVEKGSTLTVLEEFETWSEVITEDGIIGYIKNKALGDSATKTIQSEFIPEEFTHIKEDYKINLAWHQVVGKSANNNVSSILQNSKGINVLSPTWFYLKDTKGNIGSVASSDYVNYCHQQGVEVWGLVSNFGAKDHGLENPSFSEIMTYSSRRDNLVNNIISVAIQYNLDGINIDFESLDTSIYESYIQFIRELSLKCANNGIVLSVDIPAPHLNRFISCEELSNYADYIILMAYDEYYSSSEEAGPTASIGFVTDSVDYAVNRAPANQVILGMPFYSKLWCKTPAEGEDLSAIDAGTNITYDLSCRDTSMSEQQKLIKANGAEPIWLDDYGMYFVEYKNKNSIYQIWVEDAASIEQKLKVMNSYQLAGGAFWKLGQEPNSIWDTVIKYIN